MIYFIISENFISDTKYYYIIVIFSPKWEV